MQSLRVVVIDDRFDRSLCVRTVFDQMFFDAFTQGAVESFGDSVFFGTVGLDALMCQTVMCQQPHKVC